MLNRDFLNPKSVAIIGASSNPAKIGFGLVKNIIDGGFKGHIYPVNPNEKSIIGLKSYSSIRDIVGEISLAVISVPAEIVSKVLSECGEKGIKNVIIITVGFGEAGEEGVKRQNTIDEIAATYGMQILGPNCLGIIDSVSSLNASFATRMTRKGNIAVISQSGATCAAILDWADKEEIGFSHFVSLGNKANLTEDEFLEYLISDNETKIVIGYLESINNGPRFIELCKKLTKKKPFILLKSGKSVRGQKAASSHTGAIASDDIVLNSALKEAGVIRVESMEDIFEWATIFSKMELPKNNKVLIITNAGGPAVMAIDAMDCKKNISFYELSEMQKTNLAKVLPLGSSISNPLDLLGDANSKTFKSIFPILNEKVSSDLNIVILTPQTSTDPENIAKVIVEYGKGRTVVVLLGGKSFENAKSILAEGKIPVFLYPERAVRALDKLVLFSKHLSDDQCKATYSKSGKDIANKIIGSKTNLNETEIVELLEAYSIPMVTPRIAKTVEEAEKIANEIGYPVALKIASPDIIHKTNVGGVELNIDEPEVLRRKFRKILFSAKRYVPNARVSGVTVSKMVEPGVEVAIGAKRDSVFGPVVMFGLGGIYIELLKDFRLGLAPVSIEKALEMIKGIKSFKLLDGFRGGNVYDILPIAKIISSLSLMMVDFEQISEVDINPIRLYPDNSDLCGLDAKVIFK